MSVARIGKDRAVLFSSKYHKMSDKKHNSGVSVNFLMAWEALMRLSGVVALAFGLRGPRLASRPCHHSTV